MEYLETPRRGRGPANVYLRNADLVVAIRESKAQGRPTAKLVSMFQLLCDRAIKRLHYRDPMDEEDCKSMAMYDLLKYYDRFDEARGSNAFAFLTAVFKNGAAKGFKQLYNPDLKTVSLTALNNLERAGTDDDWS